MIRKFATVPGLGIALALMFVTAILAGAPMTLAQQAPAQQTLVQPTPAQPTSAQQAAQATPDQQSQPAQSPAQQPQAQQPPENQQPGGQEAPEESTSRRARPREYKNWAFNVGGGASLTSGTTADFARSGGGVAAAGFARNFSKYFGLRADVQFDNLPLRNSALLMAQAPSATSHVYSVMADPIFNIPASKTWSGYIVIGGTYFHRSGELSSSAARPGVACGTAPFWIWWGACYAGSLRLDGKFLSSSLNQYGENFGGGIAHKVRGNVEVYGEFRLLHGTHNGITTDLRPVTVGVRW